MPATRKNRNAKKGTRKVMKGGKRTLSPGLKAWNQKVMKKYREMKAKNPDVRLGDAMRALKGSA